MAEYPVLLLVYSIKICRVLILNSHRDIMLYRYFQAVCAMMNAMEMLLLYSLRPNFIDPVLWNAFSG